MKHERRTPRQLFAETQMGIVTQYGDWFHTTSEQIEEFVPGLLEEVDLEELVRAAQAWVKSADSIAMILLLVLLFFLEPWTAALLTLLFHGVWYFNKSSFVVVSLSKPLDYLYRDGTQLVISLAVISYLGIMGEYLATGIALLFFFVLKPGLLRKLWDLLFDRNSSSLSLNDRVMKMVLVRFSMHKNVSPERIRRMEKQIIDLYSSRKSNK